MTQSIPRQPQINLRADTVHTTTPGCFQSNEPVFAMPKHGNKLTPFTTGAALFADIAAAIKSAKRFILFTDWQMDYDVELEGRGGNGHGGRLSELLAERVAQGVEVKVLLYDSIEAAVYTHENEVRLHLMRLNPKADEMGKNGAPRRNPAGNLPVEVALQRPATGRAVENVLFSHHQKSIVIDGRIAFIGGMDVTYGRYCDGNFDVVADPVKHRINDMYNPGLPAGRLMTESEKRLTDEWAGADKPPKAAFGVPRPGFARPYYIIGVLSQRITDMLQRGYTVEQLEDLVQLMEIDDQIRDYFQQKARELRAVLDAVSRTLNNYSDAQLSAVQSLKAGNISEAVSTSVKADVQLVKVTLRKVGDAVGAVSDAVMEFVMSRINDFSDWFDGAMTDIKSDLANFEAYRKDPNLMLVDAGKLFEDILALPSQLVDDFVLEEGCQPRMPWQDVHCRIEGPAVHDVFANFVRRWNVAVNENADNIALGVDGATGLDWRVKPLNTQWLARWGTVDSVFGNLAAHGTAGNVSVQIVRSAAASLLALEQKHAGLLPLPKLTGKTAAPLIGAGGIATNTVFGARQMDGVLEAMLHVIRRAEAYIYIETQFFISACGKSDNFEDPIATNPLVEELANRVGTFVQSGKPFHIYMVLPAHPEGSLADGGVAKQHYWILQSIKRGRRSLIWRICEWMVRKQKQLKPGDKPSDGDVKELVQSGAWRKYLSFMNLRNWGLTSWFPRDPETGERLDNKRPKGSFAITEQVYVHSKLMIVDDAIAIIGSANCNDRSLIGSGDTELAAVIVDNDTKEMDLGNGKAVITRKFARELRVALWKKHLGLTIEAEQYTRGDRRLNSTNAGKARHGGDDLPYPPRTRSGSQQRAAKVNLEQPASPATWEALQSIARDNAAAFEKVFRHTPRNSMKKFSDVEDGWPKRLSRTVMASRFAPHLPVKMAQDKVDEIAKKDALITDFSTLPPQLQKGFMRAPSSRDAKPYENVHVDDRGLVHDVARVAAELGAPLTGFLVEMPLDFGIRERDIWLSGRLGSKAVAQELPKHTELDGTLAGTGHRVPSTEGAV